MLTLSYPALGLLVFAAFVFGIIMMNATHRETERHLRDARKKIDDLQDKLGTLHFEEVTAKDHSEKLLSTDRR
jgi:CHASE3 domain sensor protein